MNRSKHMRTISVVTKRSDQMRKINALRTIKTESIIDVIKTLNDSINLGNEHNYEKKFGLQCGHLFNHSINSYRANKIAKSLNKTINKQKLLEFANPEYEITLSSRDFNHLVSINIDALNRMFAKHHQIRLEKYYSSLAR